MTTVTSEAEKGEGLRLPQCAQQNIGACPLMAHLSVSPWLTLRTHPLRLPFNSQLWDQSERQGPLKLLPPSSLGSLQTHGCWLSGQQAHDKLLVSHSQAKGHQVTTGTQEAVVNISSRAQW